MRDTATVRRELRKLHIKQSGSLHCQLCGVDVLALYAQLRAAPSAAARRALLLARLPALARWEGLLARAVERPIEGHVWEVTQLQP